MQQTAVWQDKPFHVSHQITNTSILFLAMVASAWRMTCALILQNSLAELLAQGVAELPQFPHEAPHVEDSFALRMRAYTRVCLLVCVCILTH